MPNMAEDFDVGGLCEKLKVSADDWRRAELSIRIHRAIGVYRYRDKRSSVHVGHLV